VIPLSEPLEHPRRPLNVGKQQRQHPANHRAQDDYRPGVLVAIRQALIFC
jgi:hypothetical protein